MVATAVGLGYLVIADAKRGDIGITAEAYTRTHLDVAGADAVTVNPTSAPMGSAILPADGILVKGSSCW